MLCIVALQCICILGADEDKRGPVTKVLEKHRQDIWAISNQLRGNRTHSLPTSTHSVKMAMVDKANKFITKQRREIARIKVQNYTRN